MMTLRQVEAFRAVMICSNMTEAGRMLSVTQSAISKIMKEFEREVGFTLFHRRKGGLVPTPEAFALFEEVDRSYFGLEKISRAAHRIGTREQGRIQIAGMPAMTSGFLQRVIRRFISEGHRINATIQNYNSAEVVDLVEAGYCDIGFTMTPVDSDRVIASDVMHARCMCLLPPGHRLAARKEVSIADLEGEEFISLAEGTTTREKIDALFHAQNIPRRLSLEARWSIAIAGFVSEGLGCSITEPFTAAIFAARGGIVKPLVEEITFSFVQVQPKHGILGKLSEELLACFRQEFAEFQGEIAIANFRSLRIDPRLQE